MRFLRDSHTVIWWVDQHGFLSPAAHAAIANPNNELFVSAATIWEIGIKVGIGKLTLSRPYRDWMNPSIADLRATTLPVSVEYTQVQINLPQHHGDPFDRLLVAQALSEPDDRVGNVTNATAVDRFGPVIGGKQLKVHHQGSVTAAWVVVAQQR